MTRRSLLLALAAAAPLRAGETEDVWELLTDLAAALSGANLVAFLQWFDRSMPGYDKLETNVTGLLEQDDVQSSVEVLTDEGTASARQLEVDWFLQIVNKEDETAVTRRREVVHMRVTKEGKKWKVTSFDPIALFVPPQPAG